MKSMINNCNQRLYFGGGLVHKYYLDLLVFTGKVLYRENSGTIYSPKFVDTRSSNSYVLFENLLEIWSLLCCGNNLHSSGKALH